MTILTALRLAGRTGLQVAFFALVWLAADGAARHFHSNIPAAVWGMAAVLALLFSGILRPSLVEYGARWLLAEMLLFFIPLCVNIAGFAGLFAHEGVRLLAAILLGTAATMAGTVLIVDPVHQWERRRRDGVR
ncbi:MAG: CidA/LrgA family protein [Verrucomicrobiota bacterium]